MEVRAILYNIIISFLIFYFSFSIYDAITLPEDIFYTLLFMVLMSLLVLVHKNILIFLTVSRVFLTIFLTISILVGAGLYILDYTMPGLHVNNIVLSAQNLEFITIQDFTLTKVGTIILVSLTTGLVYALVNSVSRLDK
ncbi:MAG: hypothetical protein QY318_00225 [Candidatus Dojkabacteria bacterium]|nr:MAG: hypothetical protein QY318_00225 [Candidatus Dojkabacteria bacterium]